MPYLSNAIDLHRPCLLAGAHNGLTARLAAEAGFHAVWASSFEIAASFALPDASIVSPSSVVRVCANMVEAVALPILVDLDSGYGGHAQVFFYVKQFEQIGVHGVCIEDKVFPKHNSFSGRSQELEPIAKFRMKLRAARVARKSKDFWIVARTEALIAGQEIEEALERATAYVEEGADAIVVQSSQRDASEIEHFCMKWTFPTVPLFVIPTRFPQVQATRLADLGVRGIIYANYGVRAAVAAIQRAYSSILTHGSAERLEGSIATMAELFRLQGEDTLDRLDALQKNAPAKVD